MKTLLAFIIAILFILTIPVWLVVAAVLCGVFNKELEPK